MSVNPAPAYDADDAEADLAALADYKAEGERLGIPQIIQRMHQHRGWTLLGYDSWQSMCDAELGGVRLWTSVEDRREAVRQMTEAGMSTRAIGGALGVNNATVARDQQATVANATVGDSTSVIGLDGRTRTYPTRPTLTVDAATGEIIDDGPKERYHVTEAEKEARREESRIGAIRRYVSDMNIAFAGLSMLKHDQHRQTLIQHWEAASTHWTADDLHDLADLLHDLANDWKH